MLEFINRNAIHKSLEISFPLYSALESRHLQHCIQFRTQYFKKDVDKLQRVQIKQKKL